MTKRSDTRALASRALTYRPAGATAVADDVWAPTPNEYRRHEQAVGIKASWDDARSMLLRWGVKTRSGFEVHAEGTGDCIVVEGDNMWLRFSLGPGHLQRGQGLRAETT